MHTPKTTLCYFRARKSAWRRSTMLLRYYRTRRSTNSDRSAGLQLGDLRTRCTRQKLLFATFGLASPPGAALRCCFGITVPDAVRTLPHGDGNGNQRQVPEQLDQCRSEE